MAVRGTAHLIADASGCCGDRVQFTASGAACQRSLLVCFTGSYPPWVGEFEGGMTRASGIVAHPNERLWIVVAAGQGYLIEAAAQRCVHTFGGALCDWSVLPECVALTELYGHGPLVTWKIGHRARRLDEERSSPAVGEARD